MEGGLARTQVARIYMARKVVLIDARNLMSQKGVMAKIVIDTGRSQINNWHLTTLCMDKSLCFDFRGPVRQV